MHYLIDGYNLLFFLADTSKPLQQQRQTIIHSLQQEFLSLSLEGTLVFDGSQMRGGESGLSYKSPLTIAYTFAGETADQYILDRIKTSRSAFTVVSNDKFLTACARKEKIATLNLKGFLTLLRKRHPQETKPTSTPDLDKLEKIFEDRLKDSS